MRWLLDTNILIDAFAGHSDAVRTINEARAQNVEWVGYSAVTRLDILGFSGLSVADERGLRDDRRFPRFFLQTNSVDRRRARGLSVSS